MQPTPPAHAKTGHLLPRLGDFTTDRRVLMLVAMAIVVGAGGAVAAWVLLHAIALITNLVWLHTFSSQTISLAQSQTQPVDGRWRRRSAASPSG